MTPNDLVAKYCEGTDEQFLGVPCHGYCEEKRECQYLKAGDVESLLESGQCPSIEWIRNIVQKSLKKYPQVYVVWQKREQCQEDFTTHVETLTYLIIQELKKKADWTDNYSLPAFYNYLKETVPHRLKDVLKANRYIENMTCGDCVHLSRQKPFYCEREKQQQHQQNEQGPRPVRRRRPSMRACPNGFELRLADYTEHRLANAMMPDESNEAEQEASLQDTCCAALEERYLYETGMKRKIYKRHYRSFMRMLQLCLNEQTKRSRAIRMIAEELAISEKQMKRDLTAILEFLRAQNVLSGPKGSV